jgi:Fic family protein
MVSIKEKKVGTKTYYYLQYTFRDNGRVNYREKYLGPQIPKDIEKVKARFALEIHKEKRYPTLEKIKEGYKSELKRMPESVKAKTTEAFMIEFTYDTQRIEGSELSYRDTAQVLLEQTAPKGAKIRDIKEAEAHKGVFYEMIAYDGDLSLGLVLKWHKELFAETNAEVGGKIRNYNVRITGSKFRPPGYQHMEGMLNDFFAWYNEAKQSLHAMELAALVHLKFVTIHPFGDGNGRISRLLMNFVLKKHEYPMLNIHYKGRRSYYAALERSQTKGAEDIFLTWLFRRYLKDNLAYHAHKKL